MSTKTKFFVIKHFRPARSVDNYNYNNVFSSRALRYYRCLHCFSCRLEIQTKSIVLGVSVVSLDKALETNHLTARVGDNVEIKCDVTGSPVPPIVWRRNQLDLSTLNEEDVRVFSDGSLYLTRIQLQHAGNYTCHAQRNKDVVQTHILTVHSELTNKYCHHRYKLSFFVDTILCIFRCRRERGKRK